MQFTLLARVVLAAFVVSTLVVMQSGGPAHANGDFEQTYYQACLYAGSLSRVSGLGTSTDSTIECGRGTPVVLLSGDPADSLTHFACLYAGSLSQVGTTAPASCGRGTLVAFAGGTSLFACLYGGSISQVRETTPSNCGRGTASVTFATFTFSSTPVAEDRSLSAVPSVPREILLTATDVDSPILTFEIVNSPEHGVLDTTTPSAVCQPVSAGTTCSATVTYTGEFSYIGPDSFTYRVSDGASDSNLATVSLTLEYPEEGMQWIVDKDDGGTFEWPDHIIITIPTGGLTCDATLTITVGPPAYDHTDDPASNTYNVSLVAIEPPECPGGVELNAAATIGIYYDPTAIPLGKTALDLYLARWDGFSEWNMIGSATLDPFDPIVYTQTLLFSKWNVFVG